MKEIYELNRDIMKRFKKLFEDRGIPVVPSLGNNDIYRELLQITSQIPKGRTNAGLSSSSAHNIIVSQEKRHVEEQR